MARPQKEGLDYFPHDVDMDQDSKVIMVVAMYGMEGYGTFIKLLEQIYKEKGYYTSWNERDAYIFKSRVNVSLEVVNGVVNECLNGGFFDTEMYNKHKILTSFGIQKRYVEVAKRRKEMVINSDYSLFGEKPRKTVNVDINPVIVDDNSINDGSMLTGGTQRIVKDSKEENSKEEDSKEMYENPLPTIVDPSQKIEYFENVFLTEKEYIRLQEKLGEELEYYFLSYASWIVTQSPSKRKGSNANLTIQKWFARDQKNKSQVKPNKQDANNGVLLDLFGEEERNDERRNVDNTSSSFISLPSTYDY